MKNSNTNCTAALSSLTYAIKAQRALEGAGLYSDIVKLDSRRTRHGCADGIEFSCEYMTRVKSVMKENGIGVIKYLNGGGESI